MRIDRNFSQKDQFFTRVSYFDDPQFDHAIDAAQRLTGVARDRAYGRLGIDVARTQAPLAAYAGVKLTFGGTEGIGTAWAK